MTERQDTTPGLQPAEGATASGTSTATAPDYSPRPVAVRRPDVLAGLLLLLAGAAAAVSLLLRWVDADDASGLDLVRRGFTELGDGLGGLVDTGFWQPPTVVLGGAVLLVLGLLLFLPARRHRLLGLVALLVTAVVAAAVLVPLVQAGFDPGTFRSCFWCAVAVAVLGLLGSLKALLTGRQYRADH
jgi:hypothetical protein